MLFRSLKNMTYLSLAYYICDLFTVFLCSEKFLVRSVGIQCQCPFSTPVIPPCRNTNKPEYKSFKTGCRKDVIKHSRDFMDNIVEKVFNHCRQYQINSIVIHVGTG